MLLGHNHPAIKAAVIKAVEKGLSYGAPTEIEVLMAEKVRQIVPPWSRCGWSTRHRGDHERHPAGPRLHRSRQDRQIRRLLPRPRRLPAGQGRLRRPDPGSTNSPGVPADFAKHTLTCVFNDLDSVREAFTQYGSEIACIIVEPVAGNMNCIPPVPGFLEGLRAICDEFGALLILDEVMTGFRVSLRGAQGHYNIDPDLTTLGKIIGAGMPVGAFGGKKKVMQHIAPTGPVYQAGTLRQPGGHGCRPHHAGSAAGAGPL